ncbi:MAG: hypothetical protein M3292_05205 [Actinomycetota bacterium]|nr:hypothetical protein [Actinomycetota bacterium]
MTETYEARVQLSAADAERAARLVEEVEGRLEEIAHIAARTLGRTLDNNVVRKFVPHNVTAADTPTIVEVEILDDFLGPGTRPCCLLAFEDGDWCVECPCGAAG